MEDVREDLETLNFDEDFDKKTDYTNDDDDVDTNEGYTHLPDSLDLEELVKLSATIKSQLRELLFMLDNIPNYLRDGGLNTLEKRKSIQRHTKSSSALEMNGSAKTPVGDDADEELSASLLKTSLERHESIKNGDSKANDTEYIIHEKRKSVQSDDIFLGGLDRRKSFKRDSTQTACSFEKQPSIHDSQSTLERAISIGENRNSLQSHQRRTSIHREVPSRIPVSDKRRNIHHEMRSPERLDSISKSRNRSRRQSINWELDSAASTLDPSPDLDMQDSKIAFSPERRKAVQHDSNKRSNCMNEDALSQLNSESELGTETIPHRNILAPATPHNYLEPQDGSRVSPVKRREANNNNYN